MLIDAPDDREVAELRTLQEDYSNLQDVARIKTLLFVDRLECFLNSFDRSLPIFRNKDEVFLMPWGPYYDTGRYILLNRYLNPSSARQPLRIVFAKWPDGTHHFLNEYLQSHGEQDMQYLGRDQLASLIHFNVDRFISRLVDAIAAR